MIKNYLIKTISSVFIMLTIFMVSTSVFAADLYVGSTSYTRDTIVQKYYELGGTIDISSIPLTYTSSGYSNKFYFVKDAINLSYTKPTDSWIFKWVDSNGNLIDKTKIACLTYSSSTYEWSLSDFGNFRGTYASGTFYDLTELSVYDESGNCLYEGSYTVDSTEKKILYEVNYSEDNKTAILSAEIKNSSSGDKLYYSLLGYSITGKLMNPIELNQSQATAITLSKNTMIHLQALDSER